MLSNSRVVPLCRSVFLLLAIVLFAVRFQNTVQAMLPLCSDECDSGMPCDYQCWDDTLDPPGPSYCGQYNGGEANGMCYGSCGDGECMPEDGENCSNCQVDCGECITGCRQDSDCGSGEECVISDGVGYCYYLCTPETCGNNGQCTDPQNCQTSADCCGEEQCMQANGGQYCVLPG